MTTAPASTQGELAAWCQSYVTAFAAYDSPAIARHWAFPAMVIQGDKRFSFDSTERFSRNTDMLLGFYRARGVAGADRRLITALALGPTATAIHVEDIMRDAGGAEIVRWQAGYTLVRTPEGWRAILADAGGETGAWAAAGTPLGPA